MRLEQSITRWLGLKAHCVKKVVEHPDHLLAELVPHVARRPRCGQCGRQVHRTKGVTNRRLWRDLKLRQLPLVLAYTPRRVVCPECGVRVEQLPWAGRWSRVTHTLCREVAQLCRHTDLSTIADHYRLNWKTVAHIIHVAVDWGLKQRRQKTLQLLGLDEVSRKKGHKYLTLVHDLERGELVWIGKDRTAETLEPFFTELGPRRCQTLRAVSMDMWKPYKKTVEKYAPQALICFDRFHVVQHLNAAVDEVRREMVRKLKGPERNLVKGQRFILLKNPWNLSPTQKQSLTALVRENNALSRAWYLKEDFQRFWDYIQEAAAERHLEKWLWWAGHSRLKPFTKFATLIREHRDGILAWTKLRLSNGALEGMNNKVKLVSHRSYGFRNDQRYIEAIYHNCANLPLPAG